LKRKLAIGIFLGSLVGVAGTLGYQKIFSTPSPAPPSYHGKGEHPKPYSWLLPADFQSSQVFNFVGAQEIIRYPDSVTIHRASSTGISLMGYNFSARGAPVSNEDIQILQDVVTSPTTYSMTSACIFSPGVLYRLAKGDRRLDLLICFTCEDMGWIADEDESKSATIGLSDIGVGSFRLLSLHSFPSDPTFKQQ
jgi:hypothetical protein